MKYIRDESYVFDSVKEYTASKAFEKSNPDWKKIESGTNTITFKHIQSISVDIPKEETK